MASLGEISVALGIDISDLKKALKEARRGVNGFGREMDELGRTSQRLSDKMKAAYAEQRENFKKYRLEQLKIEEKFYDVAKASKSWKGTTDSFLAELQNLGKQQKKITDEMMKQNDMAKTGFMQGVGEMLAMSGQSEKIAKNFDRMRNPLYQVNNGLLGITDGLERMTREADPAVMALKMLGPTANMKELKDMMAVLAQGTMRVTSVSLVAAIAVGVLSSAIAKAAFGPDPAEVQAQMDDVKAIYDKALADRQEELYTWANMFEEIELNFLSPKKLMANLSKQVQIMETWAEDIKSLAKRGVDEGLIAELEKMGPAAAGEINGLVGMTDAELAKYVELWRKKHELARTQALSELEQLKIETDKQIAELANSLKPLGVAFEEFKSVWAEALQPFVDSWGEVAAKVVEFGTKIGEVFIWLNNNDMSWITKAIGWFGFLFAALVLVFSPLAAGVGLVAGFQVAWAAVAPIVMPLITGLAAMAGTIVLVIAAVAGIIAIGIGLVNTFRQWLASSEEGRKKFDELMTTIRENGKVALEALKTAFETVMTKIKEFVMPILEEMKQFWADHGTQVIEAVSTFLGFIQKAFEFAMPIIMFVVDMVLGSILGIFRGAFDMIMGLVKIFTGLFTGDWALMWEGVKQLIWGAIQVIWNWMNLSFIGKIVKGIGAFFKSMVALFKSGWDTIALKTLYFIDKVKATISGWVTAIKGFFTGLKETGLSIWQSMWGTVEVLIQAAKTKVLSISTSIYTKISGTFDDILTKGKEIFNNLKTAITTPIETAKTTVLGIIDTIKGGFEKMKIKIPKPKIPKVSVSMKKTKLGIPYPDFDIDWNAAGNIFDGASILGGGQGVGEAGAEVVMPIERKRYMKPYAQMVSSLLNDMDNGNKEAEITNNFNISSVVVREDADIQRIARELFSLQQRKNRRA